MAKTITSSSKRWEWKTFGGNPQRFETELQVRGGWIKNGQVTTDVKLIHGWGQKKPEPAKNLAGSTDNPSDEALERINKLVDNMFEDPFFPEELRDQEQEIRAWVVKAFQTLWSEHVSKLRL